MVAILNEAKRGVAVKDICRKHAISDATFCNWKARHGGLEVSELKRLKDLEATKLKRMYADLVA